MSLVEHVPPVGADFERQAIIRHHGVPTAGVFAQQGPQQGPRGPQGPAQEAEVKRKGGGDDVIDAEFEAK